MWKTDGYSDNAVNSRALYQLSYSPISEEAAYLRGSGYGAMLTLFVMVLGQSVKALIVLLALFGAVLSAQAQGHRSGNELYENCREKRQVEYVASGLCLGL